MANTARDQASPQPAVTFGVRHIAFAKRKKKKKCKLRSLKKSVSAPCGPDGENSTEMTEKKKKTPVHLFFKSVKQNLGPAP